MSTAPFPTAIEKKNPPPAGYANYPSGSISIFLGRISGAFFQKRRKPGYPLQSFLPGRAKKYFRFYPLRAANSGMNGCGNLPVF
jgi:hypothetical protein